MTHQLWNFEDESFGDVHDRYPSREDGDSPGGFYPGGVEDWSGWLVDGPHDDGVDKFRRHTRTGRPLGDPSFIERLEGLIGRVLRSGKGGPKAKAEKKGRKKRGSLM